MTHEDFINFLNKTPWQHCIKQYETWWQEDLIKHKQWVDEEFNNTTLWQIAIRSDDVSFLKFLTEECGSQWSKLELGYGTPLDKPLILITSEILKQNKDPKNLMEFSVLGYIVSHVYSDVDHQKILKDLQECEPTQRHKFLQQVDLDVAGQRQHQKILSEIEDNNNEDGRGKRRM